ncbi:RecQ family ATP-dependent DNA helicase [Flavobacterium aquidurense]|uniref:RecQ family ATP-dependent DNA helicase n=1 Tax=Flavobacterium aquidurense TaxID=362413 RepID=UPI003757CF42
MNHILSKYRNYFPDIELLYDYQEEVFNMLLARRNTLAIIPTGGGKSLLYQIMAIELHGTTVVISPLMALMEEQVNELNNLGIRALALNSNIPFKEQRKILRSLKKDDYKLIYISAERLQNPFFRAALIASGVNISLLVIDEAHCISQWGGNFRPDYGQIPTFIEFLNNNSQNPLLLCLTATIAKPSRKDITTEFKINEKDIYVSQYVIRDNLKLHFKKVNKEKDKEGILRNFLEEKKPKKTIVYLYSKNKCEKYTKSFASKYTTAFFHAGMTPQDKDLVYNNFLNGNISLLFATTAFGMGINIPDIESIVQLQLPHSVEEYYQQAGRGWRKKDVVKDCNCLLLWSNKNFSVREKDLNNQRYTPTKVQEAYQSLIGSAKIKRTGQLVNKSKDSFLMGKEYNLQLLRYKLEKRNIIKCVGELNGTPLTIKLRNNTEFWEKVVAVANDGMDSFRYICDKMTISISDISKHLYEQDLLNNIETLPAMKKDIFFEILNMEISSDKIAEIIEETDAEIDFRIHQLRELNLLCTSENVSSFLQEQLK